MAKIWKVWKKVADTIGNIQFQIIFSIFFFLLLTPLGLLTNLINDFLNTKSGPTWKKIDDTFSSIDRLKKQ